MPKESLTPALILHTRPFKETSLIVEAFTREEGRVSLVAKGARSKTKHNKRALLQAFYPVQVSWLGRSNLKTLKQIETNGLPLALTGLNNLCGLYLNELLLKLLTQWDPHPDLYENYQAALTWLEKNDSPQIVLREFELYLLNELGYAIDWSADIYAEPIDANQDYSYIPQQGFVPQIAKKGILIIKGDLINAVADYNWQQPGALALARKICKSIIDNLLAGKELNSRKLLQQTLALQAQDN